MMWNSFYPWNSRNVIVTMMMMMMFVLIYSFFCQFCGSSMPQERDRTCARKQRSFVVWFNVKHHHVALGLHSNPPLQVCLNFLRGDAGETPGMCAALTDRGINRGIVPDLPTPDWRKTNSPPMGPEQIKYTLPSSTPGVTAIRGGLSAGGTGRGRQRVRGHFRNISAITPWVYFSSCFNAWIPSYIHPPCWLYLQVEAITHFRVICRLSDNSLKHVGVMILLKASQCLLVQVFRRRILWPWLIIDPRGLSANSVPSLL